MRESRVLIEVRRAQRITSLGSLDLEVVATLLHLWLSFIAFMVVQFITFMGKFYYIYGLWIYYICG